MRPRYPAPNSIDLTVYWILVSVAAVYVFYILQTCEELGCVAVIIPIIGILLFSVIECIINIVLAAKHYHFSPARTLVTIITTAITIVVILGLAIGWVTNAL